MKLHGNAALSWQGSPVGDPSCRGWLDAQGGSCGCRCQRALRRKWVCRYRDEGEFGLNDRSSAPKRVANRTPPERVAALIALRRLRFTAAEIAGLLGMALSTVSAVLRRVGMGKLGRLGSSSPCATSGHARESSFTSTSRSSAASRAEQAGASAEEPSTTTARSRTATATAAISRLRVRARRRRRLQPARLRGGARRREGDDRSRLPAPRRRFYRRHGSRAARPQR